MSEQYNPLSTWGFDNGDKPLITLLQTLVDTDKLDAALGTIKITQTDDNYVLMVNGKEAGIIAMDQEVKLKNVVYNPDTKTIDFTFDTDEGEKTVSVDVSDLIDVYTAGDGLGANGNQFFVKIDETTEPYLSVSKDGIKISGIDEAITNVSNTVYEYKQELQGQIDEIKESVATIKVPTKVSELENDTDYQTSAQVDEKLTDVVKFTDVHDSHLPERKAIVLPTKGDIILGKDGDETFSLLQYNRWGIVDLGTTQKPINLNVPKDVRPTIQEAGQSGEEAHKMAYLSDVESLDHVTNEQLNTALEAKADKTEIPTQLPNPEALTVKLNGVDAFIYDGSSAIDGDLSITAETIPGVGDSKTLADNINEEVQAREQGDADVKAMFSTIQLAKKSELEYELQVGGAIAGTINIPKDQTLKSVKYNQESKSLDFVFITDSGEQEVSVDVSDLVDVYEAGDGLHMDGNTFSINIDPNTQPYMKVTASGVSIVGVDEALAKKVEWVDIATEDNPNRKAIVLPNHSTLLGARTSGSTVNIAMVSKWDKVDLGSAQLPMNLNGSDEHPTYNDDKMLALTDDLEALANKEEVKELGVYSMGNIGSSNELGMAASKDGVFNDPKHSVLTFTIENDVDTENGLIINEYTKDKTYQRLYRKGGIYERTITGVDSADAFKPIESKAVYYNGVRVDTRKLFSLQKSSSDADVQAALTMNGSVLPTEAILNDCLAHGYQLRSNWMPVSVTWNGQAFVLYIVGQNYMKEPNGVYSVAIKIENGVYSVFQAGNVFEFANKNDVVALQKSADLVSKLNATLTLLDDKVSMVQEKFNSMVIDSSEKIAEYDGTQTVNNPSKSYVLSGTITNTATTTAKSIVFDGATIDNDARIEATAGNVEFNGVSANGAFEKESGNSVINLYGAEYVTFKGLDFTEPSQAYNGVEIGLQGDTLPKNVLFENCVFDGTLTNNAISIFGTQDNATITLYGCTFKNVSNPLRLSNRTNAKNVTLNVVNCSVEQWQSSGPYSGFLLLEDYTSTSKDEVTTNNLFGDGKLKVNFINLMYKGKKIEPTDISTVCGTQNSDQVIYVYADQNEAVTQYDANTYPIVSFS